MIIILIRYPKFISKLLLMDPAGLFPTLGSKGAFYAVIFKLGVPMSQLRALGRWVFHNFWWKLKRKTDLAFGLHTRSTFGKSAQRSVITGIRCKPLPPDAQVTYLLHSYTSVSLKLTGRNPCITSRILIYDLSIFLNKLQSLGAWSSCGRCVWWSRRHHALPSRYAAV